MSTLTIRLPDDKHERPKTLAKGQLWAPVRTC
jgi:hypothetical protein